MKLSGTSIIIVGAGLWFNFWFQRSVFPIFAPLLIQDLGLSYTRIGIVSSSVLATTALGYILARYFVNETAIGRAFKISILIQVGSSALTGLSKDFLQLLFFQAVQGFAEGVLFVGVVALITHRFKVTERGRAYGAFESCGNFGWFLALISGFFSRPARLAMVIHSPLAPRSNAPSRQT